MIKEPRIGRPIRIGNKFTIKNELNTINFLTFMETSRLELETFCLQSKYSTIEICPQNLRKDSNKTKSL
jgi:hypothetical protein